MKVQTSNKDLLAYMCTCQLFENFLGKIAKKCPILSQVLRKSCACLKVVTIFMGEIFGIFLLSEG